MPTFCDRCGAPLGADDQRCRTCGWPVAAAPPPGHDPSPAGPSTERMTAPPAADATPPPDGPAPGGAAPNDDDADVATRAQRTVDPGAGATSGGPTEPAAPAEPPRPTPTGEAPATAVYTAPVPPAGTPTTPPTAPPATPPSAAPSAYARPTTSATGSTGHDEDPYAGWFVDDPQHAAPAAPARAGWTSYEDDRSAAGWYERGWQQYEDDPRLPPPLREDEPLDLDGGARRSGGGRVLGVLAVGVVVVLVGLAAVFFGVLRHDGGSTSAGSTPSRGTSAPSGSSASSAPASSGSSAPSSSATSTSPYPPVSLTGSACGGSGSGPWGKAAAGNTATSCPFALAVQQAWLATNPKAGDSRTVNATSPVTNKTYPMTCSGDQPVTCKGGNGAVVFLYGGTATFG